MKFKYLISLILFAVVSLTTSIVSGFQQQILQSPNVYKRVVGGGVAGTDNVVVDNLTDFSKFGIGDTVLIIQMKGIQSIVEETSLYGESVQSDGSPGKYEFLIVASTNSGTRTIQFKNDLVNTYDVNSDVQLIWVPSYYSAVVDNSVLTCPAWDSTTKTGGVLTLIVGKTLKLNYDIDVSGKGFAGGIPVSGDGTCILGNAALDYYSYDSSYHNSALKGEGPASKGWVDFTTQYPIYPNYAKGKGANFTAGGGGNGRFSGGGGGGNIAQGGRGGLESLDLCSSNPKIGGFPGHDIRSTLLAGGIFLGGGGGGSTFSGAGTATAGGRGGGIIIILCGELDGNNHAIKADGLQPSGNASGTGGAGGGGAGGSIAIYLETFKSNNLSLSAKGGQGGNSSHSSGEGGGGGGGLIWTNIALPGYVTPTVSFGIRGTVVAGIPQSNNGSTGDILSTFIPVLNGFLFNSIWSSSSGTQSDSITSGDVPPSLRGTIPVGGAGPITFTWQKKYNGSPWASIYTGFDMVNYTPSVPETETVFFRRILTDDLLGVTDTSTPVIIMPKIITGVEKLTSGGSIKIFPNPASGFSEIFINDNNRGEVEINIFDNIGRKISSFISVKDDDEFRYQLQVSEIPAGAYYLKVLIDRRNQYTARMIIR